MMIRRTRQEIVLSMLEGCSGIGTNKTNLMYKSGLNYDSFLIYLNHLMDLGLISFSEGKYRLTGEGMKTMDKLRKFKELKKSMQKMMDDIADV